MSGAVNLRAEVLSGDAGSGDLDSEIQQYLTWFCIILIILEYGRKSAALALYSV